MAEFAEGRPYAPPTYLGAVFETGRNKMFTYDYQAKEDMVPRKDILEPRERESWLLENMRVFSDGTMANPEMGWKAVVDAQISELKVAANRAKLPSEELKKTELDLKAMMAVSSSARAMESSGGDVNTYAAFITQDGKVNLNVQDSWGDFLLHNDPDKIDRVLENKLVRFFYKKIVKDAGLEINIIKDKKRDDEGKKKEFLRVDLNKINFKKALDEKKGKLMKYLLKQNPYPEEEVAKNEEWEEKHSSWKKKMSLNDYIADVLLDEEGLKDSAERDYHATEAWAAARLAADVFLVHNYTKWEFEVGNFDKDARVITQPTREWGGNPLGTILTPCFVPKVIKKVYDSEEGREVLEKFDKAFRPVDLGEGIKKQIDKLLPCSMTVHLKRLVRYNVAIFDILGDGSASGVPTWNKDVLEKNLPDAFDKLNYVYGQLKVDEEKDGKKEKVKVGKHIMGLFTARILECKALALVLESAEPGFEEKLGVLFKDTDFGARPFNGIVNYIWGQNKDGKSGLLASLASARMGFRFNRNSNRFDAMGHLEKAYDLLITNARDEKNRQRMKGINKISKAFDVLAVFGDVRKKR